MVSHENPTVYTSGQQGDLTLCRAEISEKDVIAQQPLRNVLEGLCLQQLPEDGKSKYQVLSRLSVRQEPS